MRVGFNAHLLSYRHGYRSAGISRYLDRTLAHLEPHLDKTNSVAFVGPEIPRSVPSLHWITLSRTALPTQRPFVRILWEQLILPVAAQRWQVDLVHCPAYVAPLIGAHRSVVTFHDLSYLRMPRAFNRANQGYLSSFSRIAAARATRFIAVSESTRRDMVELLGIDEKRIDVVYNGVDEQFQPIADPRIVESFRHDHNLPAQFILFLGTLEPRKNVSTLVRAYAVARRQGVTVPLVLAGGGGWGDLQLHRLIDELNLASSVRLVGFVAMEDQALWYNAASLFAYPSLFEGFGLPVLEAMAAGTPVVTSNRSSLPEVVGTAGIMVDPTDVEQLAAAIGSVLSDEDLRLDLRSRGLERARLFTWTRTAAGTFDTFRRALGTHPAPIQPR